MKMRRTTKMKIRTNVTMTKRTKTKHVQMRTMKNKILMRPIARRIPAKMKKRHN